MSDGQISPWYPEQDRIRLAILGKLIEECNELGARAARCIIHGLGENDPDTGRPNSVELAREIADVQACIVVLENGLAGVEQLPNRVFAKVVGFERWHELIAKSKAT